MSQAPRPALSAVLPAGLQRPVAAGWLADLSPALLHGLLHGLACGLAGWCAWLSGVYWVAWALLLPIVARLLLLHLRRRPHGAGAGFHAAPWYLAGEALWVMALACALPVPVLAAMFSCTLAAAAALAGLRGLLASGSAATLAMAVQVTWLPPWPLLPPAPPVVLALAAALVTGFAASVGGLAWSRARALRGALRSARDQGEQLARASRQLGCYLSPQLCRRVLAGDGQPGAVSRRRWLSLCFADLQGFTRLSDTVEPETLTAVLNDYQQAMTRVVLDHGGTLDKFMGDGVMVLFGDPDSAGRQQDALACVAMALAMHQRLAELVQGWRGKGLVEDLAMRTGIHSGYCTVGDFGGDACLSYTAIGSSVNLASRLEQAAAPGQVLISRSTWVLVRDQIACRSAGSIQVKGLLEPVPTFMAGALSADNPAPLVLECSQASLTLRRAANPAELTDLAQWLESTARQLRQG